MASNQNCEFQFLFLFCWIVSCAPSSSSSYHFQSLCVQSPFTVCPPYHRCRHLTSSSLYRVSQKRVSFTEFWNRDWYPWPETFWKLLDCFWGFPAHKSKRPRIRITVPKFGKTHFFWDTLQLHTVPKISTKVTIGTLRAARSWEEPKPRLKKGNMARKSNMLLKKHENSCYCRHVATLWVHWCQADWCRQSRRGLRFESILLLR